MSVTCERRITSLTELKPGDHIKYECGQVKKGISAMHHALIIEVLNALQVRLIHNNGEDVVEEVQTLDLSFGFFVVMYATCLFSAAEAISRARGRIGSKDYNVLFENCEHFVTWAKNGKSTSKQVQKGVGGGLVGVVAGASAGALIGSFVPVVGSIIGASIGGVAGFFGGTTIASSFATKSKVP